MRRITERNLDEIKRLRLSNRPPGIQGYHLDIFAEKFTPHQANPRPAGLHHLIVGSQGTLGFVTKADLNLVPMPRFVGFLVAHFQSLHAVSDALALCLEVRPRAVELLDGTLLNLLHCQDSIVHRPDLRRLLSLDARLLPPDYHVVVIEMSGDSETELRNELSRLKSQLQSLHSSANTIHVMENRKQGTGEREKQKSQGCFNNPCSQFPNLYSFLPGTIVEEMAIPLEAFSEFTTRFRKLLKSHELDGAYYGYVDHIQGTRGILHLCPVVSFTNTQDAQRMRQVVRDLTTLVRQGNGLQEGELSGDPAGIEWNSRTFSRQIYAAFGNVKGTFDPKNLFNPGKIVQSAPRDRTLRYGPECRPKPLETVFDYSSKDSETRLAHSVEKCNGSGECRKRQGGTMCPSYRVTLDEKDSTRGRANVLRMALVSDDPMAELQKEATHDVLDLCLMCKACKSECPMGIDMTKLKAEFLNIYHRKHLRPPRDLLTGWMFRWYRLGSFLPKTVNWGNRNSVIRWWLEQLGGIDRRRSLPLLHSLSFRSWMARHNPHPKAGTAGKVLLLDDCMMTYTEPEIGKAAVTILEATGHAVELVSIPCCGRPMINKGFLPSARKLIAGPISRLARRASDAKAILGLEPSCLLTLVDEWPDLIPTPQAKTIAAKTHLLDHWLVEQVLENRVHLSFREKPGSCLVHGHCHQKALLGAEGTADALRLIPQFEVTLLDTGCCGMAGSFGYEKEHYDLSVAIAKDDLIPKLKERPEGVVVAPGTACRQQIRDLTTRRVWHPLEILAQQLDFHPVNNHPLRSTEKPEPETSP
ncbi:MAG: FAD-binding and (Fe-S)-binding domain-containing protein [Gemmataceae bacterium]